MATYDGHQPAADLGALPSEVAFLLQLGIFKKLNNRYVPYFGNDSPLLSVAIVNFLLVEEPGNEDALRYKTANQVLIEQQAQLVSSDPDLSFALSVLCSFTLVQLGPKHPDRSNAIESRASQAGIVLRTTNELYPTDDGLEFLKRVREYASDLLKEIES
jgi:hypothetical protein